MATFAEIDRLIRAGELAGARAALRTQVAGKRPASLARGDRLEASKLFRRLGEPGDALKMLHSLVRDTGKKKVEPSESEKLEYGVALIQLGGSAEGLRLLREVNSEKMPAGLLFQAFGYFATWDYADALPLLDRYLSHPKLSDYEQLVGGVNLAAAQVATEQYTAALSLIGQLQKRAEAKGHRLLSFNLREIQAQALILSGDSRSALEAIRQAESIHKQIKGTQHLWFERWKIVAQLRIRADSKAIGRLKALQARARDMALWEIVRDCDFRLAEALDRPQLWQKLYFGTPHAAYRRRVLRHLSKRGTSYHWRLLSKRGPSTRIDLLDGSIRYSGSGSREIQTLPNSVHLLLNTLAADFYHPQNVLKLYTRLFPGQYYNPMSSPNLVHQRVSRGRRALSNFGVPLKIAISPSGYHFVPKSSITLVCGEGFMEREPLASSSTAMHDNPADYLKWKAFLGDFRWDKHEELRASEISARSGRSMRSVYRLLGLGVSLGLIARQGRGPQSCYRQT